MNNNSPLETLAAFGLCFVAGLVTREVFNWAVKKQSESK